ncbi:MAG TPA: M48 family metallopeptidase [Candidatus Methylomirabilis sp.]|nr:M48 family metallopeptidase [Candidatus Methylomirabilis sp.]
MRASAALGWGRSRKPRTPTDPAFRRAARRAVAAIGLFLAVYLGMICALMVIVLLFGGIGLAIIWVLRSLVGIFFGGGLIALSLLLLTFPVKFFFATQTDQRPNRLEIPLGEHPRLRAVLARLAADISVSMPRRVFLTPEVNAGVCFTSSLWSLVFPVRRNLRIGLGLLNAIDAEELRAILAHEFAHFSQRSMHVGSYVYTANLVIDSLVYSRDEWDELLGSWAAKSGVWGSIGKLGLFIVTEIRLRLTWVRGVVHQRYQALSREMELHADTVAAECAGAGTLMTGLRRIDFAERAYTDLLEILGRLQRQKQRVANLYAAHRMLMRWIGQDAGLHMAGDLPLLAGTDDPPAAMRPRLHYSPLEASHPSPEEREAHLRALGAAQAAAGAPAWELLENPLALQTQMTELLYAGSDGNQELQVLDAAAFEAYLQEEERRRGIPKALRPYYAGRLVTKLDIDALIAAFDSQAIPRPAMAAVHAPEVAARMTRTYLDRLDRWTLQAIQDGTLVVASFDFDGVQHPVSEVGGVLQVLEKDIADHEAWLGRWDETAFAFYLFHAAVQPATMQTEYLDLCRRVQRSRDQLAPLSTIRQDLECCRQALLASPAGGTGEMEALAPRLRALEVALRAYFVDNGKPDYFTRLEEGFVTKAIQDLVQAERSYFFPAGFDRGYFTGFYTVVRVCHQAASEAYASALAALTALQVRLLDLAGIALA